MGCIKLKPFLLELILGFSSAISNCLLLPISKAVIIDIALASPIPLNSHNFSTDNFAKALILPFTDCNILFDKPTALSSLFPEPIKIAINSASDKANLPFATNFSLGLSSKAQVFMVSFSIINFYKCTKNLEIAKKRILLRYLLNSSYLCKLFLFLKYEDYNCRCWRCWFSFSEVTFLRISRYLYHRF